MLKQFLTYLLFAFLAFSAPVASMAADNPVRVVAPPGDTCEAPTPAGLAVINVTPTTVTLTWIATSYQYYKIDVFDLTAGFGWAPIYIVGTSATITNLTPNHHYQVDLSASYCPNGPFSDPISTFFTTPSIVIEEVVYLQGPCTPPTGNLIPTGTTLEMCVAPSNTTTQPYSNGVVGKVTYDNQNLFIGMAWLQSLNEVHFRKLGNQGYASYDGFTFTRVTNPNNDYYYIRCDYFDPIKHEPTEIFNVTAQADAVYPGYAHIYMAFKENCIFSRCGTVSCGTERSDGQENGSAIKVAESNTIAAPFPNPFGASARVQYTLAESTQVEIGLYDVLGNLVQTVQAAELLPAGDHEAVVNGNGLANGVYFLRMQTGSEYKTFSLVKQQ